MLKSMPFGRVNEYLGLLSANEKERTAIKHGLRLGDDSTVKTWRTRQAMAKAIRKDERDQPRSDWSPLVKLTDGEGY